MVFYKHERENERDIQFSASKVLKLRDKDILIQLPQLILKLDEAKAARLELLLKPSFIV